MNASIGTAMSRHDNFCFFTSFHKDIVFFLHIFPSEISFPFIDIELFLTKIQLILFFFLNYKITIKLQLKLNF